MISNLTSSNIEVNDMVLESSISLIRNFNNYLFVDKMKIEDARNLVDTIFCILCSKEIEEGFTLTKLWECSDEKIKVFLDRNIITEKAIKRKDKSAIISNKDESLIVIINEEDHIRIKCTMSELNLKEAYEYANEIDNLIEEDITYSFSETLGYLTTSISNVGTGLKAMVLVHLPVMSLSEEIPNITKGLSKVGMNVEGLYREERVSSNKVYTISNQITLGIKEVEIINSLEEIVKKLANEEKKFREVFNEKYRYELEDRIYRSYGILKNAKLLREKEVIDLLSYIRIGAELSLLNLNKNELDRLLIETKNSVIQSKCERELDNIELDLIRADIVRRVL